MIKIKNLYKSFGDKVIFDDFNLNVDTSDYVMVSGNSGCGKTTLLNIIGGLEKVDKGDVNVFDLDITKRKNLQRYYSKTVGFVFQNFALIEDKTVLENLNLVNIKNRNEVSVDEALERVGLTEKIHNKIYTLSGGEQQRIALARLMIKQCDLILADEPTGSLDKNNAKIVMDILRGLNDDGKTIIVVSHDQDIIKMGNRVIVL